MEIKMNRILKTASLASLALMMGAASAYAAPRLPYAGFGDPDGLALTIPANLAVAEIDCADGVFVPYSGHGDPMGTTLSIAERVAALCGEGGSVDDILTGSIGVRQGDVPYTGLGDPDGLTSTQH
jgi:hypothetical protein